MSAKRTKPSVGKKSARIVQAVTLMLCCALALRANAADEIEFSTGERLTGQIVSVSSKEIVFNSNAIGLITVPWSRISKASRAVENESLTMGAVDPSKGLHDVLQHDFLQRNEFKPPAAIQAGPTESVTSSRTGPMPEGQGPSVATQPTSVNVSVPFSYVYGTQSQSTLGADFLVNIRQTTHICDSPSWLTTLHLSGNHARTWKVKSAAITTNTYDTTLQLENGFSRNSRTAYYGIVDLAGNNALGIGLQQSYGGGISHILYSNECVTTPVHGVHTIVFSDLRYLHERLYAPSTPLDLVGVRFGQDTNYTYTPNGTMRLSVSAMFW